MNIHRASDMGFCFGVRRAVDMMKEAAANGTRVTTLGQVVHNPQVVAELEQTGIMVKEDRSAIDVDTETVAITAHGGGRNRRARHRRSRAAGDRYHLSVRLALATSRPQPG